MAVDTGRLACLDGVSTMAMWMIASGADVQAIIASNTKGAPARKAGNVDWSGRYTAFGHTPVWMPSQAKTFIGSTNGSKGCKGNVLVDSAEIVIDIAAGAVIQHTVELSANGALDRNDTTSVSDATTPDGPSSKGCKVEIATPAGTPSWDQLADVQRVTLRFSSDNKPYIGSAVPGHTVRKRGNFDLELSIPVLADSLGDVPAENEVKLVRVYVDATTYWDIAAVIFNEATDFTVDRQTGALIGCTLNAAFTGFYDVAGTPTEGFIKTPAVATWWPES